MTGRLLFVCHLNMVRSPMAEGLARRKGFEAVSCGLEPGEPDDLMMAVMREVGIDMSGHDPKSLQSMADEPFDRIIAFTDETFAASKAVFGPDAPVELWSLPMPDSGSYDVRAVMDGYRAIRSVIANRLDRLT
ncbi:low molecular weight phosphatase family protein [uncultured Algimonas sp.]|uniref:arsenate-mycothiol transferase ArsC n=1 Tax=uncultured Algimonas sp. TaxID=1547920 RepID=UPI0026248188|nr:low molecular weight phosphatase family protein [uncultured Algimonas sp.]